MSTKIGTATATAALLTAAPASAHLVGQRFGDYYIGLLHPITALGHALAFAALALLAGQQASGTAKRVLGVFTVALLAGSLVAPSVPALPGVGLFNRTTLLVLGLLVALAAKPAPALLTATAGIFGVSHGYENGIEITADLSPWLYSAGVASAGVVCVTLLAAVTLAPRPGWVAIAARAGGSWIAAIGLMMLGLAASGR